MQTAEITVDFAEHYFYPCSGANRYKVFFSEDKCKPSVSDYVE